MERHVNYFIIGVSVLALMLGLMGFVIWLTKFQSGRGFDQYLTYFNSASGLRAGSYVQYHGIPVGEVTRVRVDPENIERIEVSMRIAENIVIKQDAYATVQLQGIAGNIVVQINGGTTTAPTLTPDPKSDKPPIIASEPSPQIFEQLSDFLNQAEGFFTEENQKAVTITLDNLAKITTALADEKEGLPAISKSVNQISGNMAKYFDPKGPADKQIMANLNKTIYEANGFFTSFGSLVKNSSQPIEDFSNTGLYELTQSLTELHLFMDQVRRLFTTLEQDPSRFIFGNQQEGYRVPE